MDLLNDKDLKESLKKSKKKKPKKRRAQFNILSGDSTSGHGGFGVGVLNLDNMTPVIIDLEEEDVYIDMGALHARSRVEHRIRFLPNKEDVPNGKFYWLVWVTILYKDSEPYYGGVTSCEMTVDREIRRGYKNFPYHVNMMDKSHKGHIVVDHMDDKSKQLLADFLKNHNEDMWLRSEPALHEGLQPEDNG